MPKAVLHGDNEEDVTEEAPAEVVEDPADEQEPEILLVEDLPDDEEIWEGGPTAGQIKAWKEEYGDVYLTRVTFDQFIVWRTLFRNEYKQLIRKVEELVNAGNKTQAEINMFNEELTCSICSLHPKMDQGFFDKCLAGLPMIISQQVMEASGFATLDVRQL